MKKKNCILMGVMLTSIVLTGCNKERVFQYVQALFSNSQTETEKADDDDLLDQFIAGKVNADRSGIDEEGNPYSSELNISDLSMDEEEWDSFRIGDRIDLDNDGEDELILEGPYGGMYLDSSNDKVTVFASGEGTAGCLSYTNCDNQIWIVHSDTMHTGREYYKLDLYSGADQVTDSVILSISDEEDEDKKYYIDDNEVTESKYNEVYNDFFGEGEE